MRVRLPSRTLLTTKTTMISLVAALIVGWITGACKAAFYYNHWFNSDAGLAALTTVIIVPAVTVAIFITRLYHTTSS